MLPVLSASGAWSSDGGSILRLPGDRHILQKKAIQTFWNPSAVSRIPGPLLSSASLLKFRVWFNGDRHQCLKGKSIEHMDVLEGDAKEKTSDIPVRVIAVKLDTGETEYLATNIFDKNITSDMFRELYFKRWPVESKYHELKSTCLLEEFSGATANSIIQEFYITLLISNLSALIKEDADEEIAVKSRSTNKHRYQSNRTFIIGRIRILLLRIISGTEDISILVTILEDACLTRSQILHGRKFKCDLKKQKKRSHFRNRKQSF